MSTGRPKRVAKPKLRDECRPLKVKRSRRSQDVYQINYADLGNGLDGDTDEDSDMDVVYPQKVTKHSRKIRTKRKYDKAVSRTKADQRKVSPSEGKRKSRSSNANSDFSEMPSLRVQRQRKYVAATTPVPIGGNIDCNSQSQKEKENICPGDVNVAESEAPIFTGIEDSTAQSNVEPPVSEILLESRGDVSGIEGSTVQGNVEVPLSETRLLGNTGDFSGIEDSTVQSNVEVPLNEIHLLGNKDDFIGIEDSTVQGNVELVEILLENTGASSERHSPIVETNECSGVDRNGEEAAFLLQHKETGNEVQQNEMASSPNNSLCTSSNACHSSEEQIGTPGQVCEVLPNVDNDKVAVDSENLVEIDNCCYIDVVASQDGEVTESEPVEDPPVPSPSHSSNRSFVSENCPFKTQLKILENLEMIPMYRQPKNWNNDLEILRMLEYLAAQSNSRNE